MRFVGSGGGGTVRVGFFVFVFFFGDSEEKTDGVVAIVCCVEIIGVFVLVMDRLSVIIFGSRMSPLYLDVLKFSVPLTYSNFTYVPQDPSLE